ncbi:MAG: hypothetical protein A3E98_04165 [Candidatus Doudnabacteria bacterium RIFCSPHIGHO2_12_FULL_48_11]|uniref:Fibronectin type-III domain-containing protein n=1 Tax=Candidatus Doudnabacteria bacterium RIFCSPHIGHO2_01_FULL_46_24 TaxID=1817825 RepID=A0A1F5NW91_9BACT|nr:MAG: hypothetical protein A2720_00705 [Candidatus Doudnabacteria bacterium RIFCSPHIGHO2_01_FULL_46_24]OGE95990.1 MAG: hypothetical protein A3E98_04165 [Candidatus Doudnabacteria bacterium RIFCSPHIGHO2_12_FULL_48_11]
MLNKIWIIIAVSVGLLFFILSGQVSAGPRTDDPYPGDDEVTENPQSPTEDVTFSIYCKSGGAFGAGLKNCYGSGRIGIGQMWRFEAGVEAVDPTGGDGDRVAVVDVCINNTGVHNSGNGYCWALPYNRDYKEPIPKDDFATYRYLAATVVVKGSAFNDHWHQHRFWGYGRSSESSLNVAVNPASVEFGQTATVSWSARFGKNPLMFVGDGREPITPANDSSFEPAYSDSVFSGDWVYTADRITGEVGFTYKFTGINNAGVEADFELGVPLMVTQPPPAPPREFPLTVSKSGTGLGTVTSSPVGITCGSDCLENYTDGANVSLTANPAGGSEFIRWSGDCAGSGSCSVTMTSSRNVTAVFNTLPPGAKTLSLSKSGTGSGTVTSSPAAINCGSGCSSDSADFSSGTEVSLFANPAVGSEFIRWSGDCAGSGSCSVTMSSDQSVTAVFNLLPAGTYNLSVSKTGTGSGTISGPGINCGSDCSESYTDGTNVNLTANPAGDSEFVRWSGDCTSANPNNCSVRMDRFRSVTAEFRRRAGLSQPSCNYAEPQSPTTANYSGTFNAYAYGVLNATSVYFPTWSGGFDDRDDLIWYPGTNLGSGTWRADINLASHSGQPPFTMNVHVYMNNASFSNIWCDDANFTRTTLNDPITFTITYTQRAGTLQVDSSIAASWNISGVGDRSGTQSSDLVSPGSYTITPTPQTDYNFSVSPNPATVNANQTTIVNITWTAAPLGDPTGLSADPSVCKNIALSWSDNAQGESGYIIYRATSSLPADPDVSFELTRIPANRISYTDSTGSENTTYYYRVRAYKNNPAIASNASNEASALVRPCVANISNSTKALLSPANPDLISDGNTVTFRITIVNSAVATAAADIRYITDTYTANWQNPRVINVSGGLSCVPNLASCLSGSTINVQGQIDPGQNAVVDIQGTVNFSGNSNYDSLANTAQIFYRDVGGDGSVKSIIKKAGPYLVKTGNPRVPQFREVAP